MWSTLFSVVLWLWGFIKKPSSDERLGKAETVSKEQAATLKEVRESHAEDIADNSRSDADLELLTAKFKRPGA